NGLDIGHGISAGVKGSAFEGDTYVGGEAGGRNGSFGSLKSFRDVPGATNPGYFPTLQYNGLATIGSNTITNVLPDPTLNGLALGWSLPLATAGFPANVTVTGFTSSTITFSAGTTGA